MVRLNVFGQLIDPRSPRTVEVKIIHRGRKIKVIADVTRY